MPIFWREVHPPCPLSDLPACPAAWPPWRLAGCLLLAGCQRQDAPGGETPESATAETATAEAADPDASASAEAEAVIAQTGAVLAETPDAGRSYV